MALQAPEIIIDLALLAAFLISITASRYAAWDNFTRTRFIMSALFIYIVASLTVSFWQVARSTIPFVIPAFIIGLIVGELVGARTARQKLFMEGMEGYMEHFAHIRPKDLKNLTWWSFVNYYSVSCALILINLIGLAIVLHQGSRLVAIETSVVGATLIGSILPYLIHLWRLPREHATAKRVHHAAKRHQ
jgi:hypothetical protein